MSDALLIAGLGNPGDAYARHRHNVGFMVLDAIAAAHKFSPFRARYSGEVAEGVLNGRKALLLKPMTYMNESGRSVGAAARFLKIPLGDVIVFHDEVDLAPGKFRVKTGGGDAGHNGLRSITATLGPDYRRVRIGVGHPGRPEAVPGFVLQNFSKEDKIWLEPMIEAMAKSVLLLEKNDDAGFMNRVALLTKPQRPNAEKPGAEKPAGKKTDKEKDDGI
jgi:PTH1 family peptidyl-tRNA hydrolase